MTATEPFPGQSAPEVPLPDAPLLRVISQLRFAPIASITRMEFIAPFQDVLRDAYPVMEDQHAVNIEFGPAGVTQTRGDRQWKFTDTKAWTVTLNPSFVSIETTEYTSRDDFVSRLAGLAAALEKVIGQVPIDRLGVRYTDRIVGERVVNLRELVRPEALGAAGFPLGDAEIYSALEHGEFQLADGARLLARWGCVPAGVTFTPDVAPVDDLSWVLDIDVAFVAMPLVSARIEESARTLCEHAYDFFRWIVTEEFLTAFGGKLK